MLFAIRRGAEHHAGEDAWRRAQVWLERIGATCVETDRALLAATLPSRIEARDLGAVAWAHAGDAGSGQGPELRLARDALQIVAGAVPQYPVYYYDSGDGSLFVACSQLRPLRELLPHTGALHVDRIIELASWQMPLEARATVFRDLRRLLPCEAIEVGVHGASISVSIPPADPEANSRDLDQLARVLRERLEHAVANAIGAAKHATVFVGGGLDSSGILALALARTQQPADCDVAALAEVWAAPGDDRPHLEALEQYLGISAVRLPASAAGKWVIPSLFMDDQPQSFPAASLDLLLLETAHARNSEVALAGHSGDDVLGGPLSFASAVLEGHPFRAVSAALRLQLPERLSASQRLLHWIGAPLAAPFLPAGLRRTWRGRQSRRAWMRPRFVERLEQCESRRPERPPRGADARLAAFLTQPFFAELATYWGQLESAIPAAVVDVFLDPHILRFVGALDSIQLSADHRHRGLYRRAMRGLLPETVRQRSDKALGQPAHAEAIVAARAEPELRDLASLSALADNGLVDPGPFRPVFDAWLSTVRMGERTARAPADESWHTVWQLLSVESFLRSQRR